MLEFLRFSGLLRNFLDILVFIVSAPYISGPFVFDINNNSEIAVESGDLICGNRYEIVNLYRNSYEIGDAYLVEY